MSFGRKRVIFGISAVAAFGAAALPMANGFAFESGAAVTEDDGELLAASGVELVADTTIVAEPTIALDDAIEAEEVDAVDAEEETAAIDETVDADLICMVKVVRHEAANQSLTGQLAVAQLIMNRVNSSNFPDSICSVVHQRGQFFNTNAYNPSRGDGRWERAMEVSLDARSGVSDPVVADAVFYHAAYVSPRFFRTRERVMQLEDHIFYR